MSLPAHFRALRIEQEGDDRRVGLGDVPASILAQDVPEDQEVLIEVGWSTINYKDAMMLAGVGYRLETSPFVPGIDLAGTVIASRSPAFRIGDSVVLNGYGAGEHFAGGYCAYARARADWLVPVPQGWTARDTMAVGTAGMTAMLAIMELEQAGVGPASGEILVTGAAGGLGSMATAMLARLGYTVVASTGRMEETAYLHALGAASVVPRSDFDQGPGRAMLPRRWAGCIDAVGGKTLSTAISSMGERGVVAACGLAGGNSFTASLIPFFLRGVRVIGIEGGHGPIDERRAAWARIPEALDRTALERITHECTLDEVVDRAADVLAGHVRGRIVVDHRR